MSQAVPQTSAPTFRLYYRSGGCINEYCTYVDYLVLENYVNNTYHLNELANLASSYLDTAKGDLPIKGVVFVGEEPDSSLPPGMYKTYDEHVKFQVVSISFGNSVDQKANTGPRKKDVKFIALWKEGVAETFSLLPLDSLLKSNPLLDNGN